MDYDEDMYRESYEEGYFLANNAEYVSQTLDFPYGQCLTSYDGQVATSDDWLDTHLFIQAL